MKSYAVVGGGISGLAAAHAFQKAGHEVTVFEASDRFGGALHTVHRHGCLMECGPDSLLVTKPAAIELARELGVELIPSCAVGPPGVVHQKRIEPLPDGFRLLAPTKLIPFAKTPLLSAGGKLRAGMEFLMPAARDLGDESVADFVTRRFGSEVLDSLAQPLIGGIYAADPARLSLLATLPIFRKYEESHGSVTAGVLAQIKGASKGKGKKPGSMFKTPRLGMGSLVEALVKELKGLRAETPVNSLRLEEGRWQLEAGGSLHDFDGVVLACSAPHLAQLTRFDEELSGALGQISSTTTVTIHFLFDQEQILQPLSGSGFVVPHREDMQLTACTFSHLKYEGRAPEGKALFRCHLGNAMNQLSVHRDDQDVIRIALTELSSLVKIEGEPSAAVLVRHSEVLPQYQVGHLDLVETIEEQLSRYPGLALAGNGLEGVGVSDCIKRARAAVERLLN